MMVHVQDITILPAINGLETEDDAEDGLSWEQNERLLNQADEDEEVDAEADATEADPAAWTSYMPTWMSSPEELDSPDEVAPPSSINWSFQVTAPAFSHKPCMYEQQIAEAVLSLLCDANLSGQAAGRNILERARCCDSWPITLHQIVMVLLPDPCLKNPSDIS